MVEAARFGDKDQTCNYIIRGNYIIRDNYITRGNNIIRHNFI